MKTIYSILFLLIVISLKSQIAIGKSTVDGDGILDFVSNSNMGIVLPRVITVSNADVPGTLIYNTNTEKVEVMLAGGEGWFNISGNSEIVDTNTNLSAFDVTDEGYDSLTETTSNIGVVFGTETSNTPDGVLILESSNKALILPKTENAPINIVNPEAGTIAYDTTSHTLCVFNGIEWAFWGVR